jgi:hypothetical protein
MKSKIVLSPEDSILRLLHVLVFLLSAALVIDISIDTFRQIPFYTHPEFLRFQFCVCILFLIDFWYEFALADRKRHYLRTHFVFLLVALPYHQLCTVMGIEFTPTVSYLMRFVPLIRGGYALAILVRQFSRQRATNLFFTYLTVLFSVVYFCSLVFFVIERGLNPPVQTYPDALWWAAMNTTTVGSNIVAVTGVGQVMSVILAAAGMMMFPIFTVYVTNLVKESRRSSSRI